MTHPTPGRRAARGVLAVGLALAATPAALAQGVPTPDGWALTWNDEFDGQAVDTDKWEVLTRQNSFNNEKQFYIPEQAAIVGGKLRITATDQPLLNKQYRSARLESWFTQAYGRVEVVAKIPTTKGIWPAIWLLPNRGVPWPQGGEIDIMEHKGSQPDMVSSAYHYANDAGQHRFVFQEHRPTVGGQPVLFPEGFHEYAVEWSPREIKFFVDGFNHYTITAGQVPISSTPMNIILNTAVGGDFDGDPNGSTVFPQFFDIEHVRVFERHKPDLANPGFDQGGLGEDWFTFGSGVSSSGEASLDGGSALKVFGQFNGQTNFSGAAQGITVEGGQTITAAASSFIRSADSLAGSDNRMVMKLEFYSAFDGDFDSDLLLDFIEIEVASGESAQDVWERHEITAVAPEGAKEARVAFVFVQQNNAPGAVFVDAVELGVQGAAILGDLNGDGFVGAGDLDVLLGAWNQNVPAGTPADLNGDGFVGAGDLDVLLGAWNQGEPPAASQLPEPTSALLMSVGAVAIGLKR